MALDIEIPGALQAYLQQNKWILPDEKVDCYPLSGGVSNRTVLVRRVSGEAWVVKQALEKLRVPVDWFSDPMRIHREALALRVVAEFLPPGAVPRLIFEDWGTHLVAMSAVPEPHANWKSLLLQGDLQESHIDQFAMILSDLHRCSAEQADLFADQFADYSFFESLRLEPYYAYSAIQLPEAAPLLAPLMAGTRQRRYCIVHGDFSPKNILVCEGQLILLDYEVIHWGDPAFDVGFSLTHLLSKAHHLRTLREKFAQAAMRYWQSYYTHVQAYPLAEDLEWWSIRHTLACLLARVVGRSPLEYLSSQERHQQQQIVLALLQDPPLTIEALIGAFVAALRCTDALH